MKPGEDTNNERQGLAPTMKPDADAIADCVLSTFERLPDKRKPRLRSDGSREWVPLSGIVLVKGDFTPTPTPSNTQTSLEAYAYRTAKTITSHACPWGK